MPLLDIQDLTLEFITGRTRIRAADGVCLQVEAGSIVGLAGESGCGKSVTALSIGRLVPSPPARYLAGRILLDGRDVLAMSRAELNRIRGGVVSYVFQDPAASLNPVFRIGTQIRETLKLHRPGHAGDAEAIRLLQLVGIPAPALRLKDFPFQLSGGMRQRVMLAMALASQPRLLIADEPTTALDVTIQAQILDLLQSIQRQLGMSILLITHNLAILGDLADRIVVMYAGQVVESAPARELLARPLHPYTKALIHAAPRLAERQSRLETIPGSVPRLDQLPAGCRFAPRCAIARPGCWQAVPSLLPVEPGRQVRCPYWNSVPSHA